MSFILRRPELAALPVGAVELSDVLTTPGALAASAASRVLALSAFAAFFPCLDTGRDFSFRVT